MLYLFMLVFLTYVCMWYSYVVVGVGLADGLLAAPPRWQTRPGRGEAPCRRPGGSSNTTTTTTTTTNILLTNSSSGSSGSSGSS